MVKNSHRKVLEPYMYMKTKAAAAAAKSLQSCLTLCDPIDGSSLGSSVPGILQARTLEWVAIAFSQRDATVVHFLCLVKIYLSVIGTSVQVVKNN